MNLLELLQARQWLLSMSNSNIKGAELAANKMRDIDKELWSILISEDTPWGFREPSTKKSEKVK